MQLTSVALLIALFVATTSVAALPLPAGEQSKGILKNPDNPKPEDSPHNSVKWHPETKDNQGNRKDWEAEQEKLQNTPEAKKERERRKKEDSKYQAEQTKDAKEKRSAERAKLHEHTLAKQKANAAGQQSS